MKKKKVGFCSAVVVAAGSGTRMQLSARRGEPPPNKVFLELCGEPVLARTLGAFEECHFIDEIVLVTRECDLVECKAICDDFGISKLKTITVGGQTRQESVRLGLAEVSERAVLTAIHDAARCLVSPEEIGAVVVEAMEYGAAALGVPCKDSLKKVDEDGFILSTIEREHVWQVQTPQVFGAAAIREAHRRAAEEGVLATDDCALAERYGLRVRMVRAGYANFKITTPEDMLFAEGYLSDSLL